jgi:fibronectin type 3 domain-containing protein
LRAAAACDGFFTARVTLSWRPSPTRRSDGYAVYRSQSLDGPFRKVELLPGRDSASFVDTGLGTATRYYYVIQATSGSRLSAYSAPVQARTPTVCLF